MRPTCKIILPVILGSVFILQSCIKDPHHFPEDKLLLSKVTGSITSQDPNFFPAFLDLSYTFTWSSPESIGPNTGNFQTDFTYEKYKNGSHEWTPLSKETFINKGYYHFLYKNALPDKVADTSVPGFDFGYWKYYLNNKAEIEKTGLAFKTAEEPSEFEVYNYDTRSRLDSFLYETSPGGTPFMKTVYKYDHTGEVYEFTVYLAVAAPNVSNRLEDLSRNVSKSNVLLTEKKKEAIKEKLSRRSLSSLKNGINQDNLTSSKSSGTAFSYVPVYIGKITTDGKINPFSQQDHILFYQTIRKNIWDPTPFFLCLLKSNPVKVEYIAPESSELLVTQTFSYSYNSKGLPVTVHEEFSDPNFVYFGSYTRDAQIEYIKNE